MFWLIAIILSYLSFALASLGDKIVLSGPSKPKSYTFFVGILSLFSVFIIPFVEFGFPSGIGLAFIVLEAIVYVAGLYAMFYALENFDVSKVMPTIGATQPVIIAILSVFFWGYQKLEGNEILAFIILLTGSVLISIDKNPKITKKSLEISLIASFLFSLDFIYSKFVFTEMSFWQGFIWMRIFSFIFVLIFLFDKGFRKEMEEENSGFNKKTGIVFIVAQIFGGLANILQSWAIFLVPVSYLAIMNSMKGIQYVFLFVLVVLISSFLPKVLKEEINNKIIIQKIVSILLIGLGLAILVL
ncbi:MAG TPA: EamA family transporter [Candidatus Pacearchaeota archaeon]|nr:EamA family transporter [Candidatus Pacearchaeota archaeon]HPR79895.1 EamA family transporter [Candidatus Pacearchaeota archaeon]